MANIKINDVPQRIQYVATSGQASFPIPYPFLVNTDIVVWQNTIKLSMGGAPGQYGLTGAGTPSGGTLLLVTGATTGDVITITGETPIDRTSIYNAIISNLTGDDLNSDLNRIIIMLQELWTVQNYMMLQYTPYLELSQDINDTVDRWLPILPPGGIWRKNDDNTGIDAAVMPPFPVGSFSGDFNADNRLVRTRIENGNEIEQMNVELTDALIMRSIAASWGINSAVDLNIGATQHLTLQNQRWPATIGTNGQVIGVIAGVLGYLNVATAPGATIVNRIPKFTNVTGAIDDSLFAEDGTDLLLPADPTQNLAAATKQYVDAHTSGVLTITGTTDEIDVDSTDPANPILSLAAAVTSLLALLASLEDGEVLIGSTGNPPVAATLTAGANVTITETPGGIEIAASASGGQVDSVVGTADQIDVDNADPVNPVLSISSTMVFPGTVTLNADPTTNLEAATKQYVDSLTGGSGVTLDVTQANSFAGGEWVYLNSGTYTVASNAAAATAEVVGVVAHTPAPTGTTFTLQTNGILPGESGRTAGVVYFLGTGGALTATPPTADNTIVKPLMVANTTTSGIMINFRGEINEPASFPYDLAFLAGFSTSGTNTDVAVQTYGELVMARTGSFTGDVGKCNTAPTGAAMILDVLKNGTTIYTTKPQFAASATSMTNGVLKTDGTEDFVSGDVITFKITQVGSSAKGQGVKFTLAGVI